MANLFGALSNVNTTATPLLATAQNSSVALYLKADPANPNTVAYGFANTVTFPLALTNTVQDNTVGYLIKAGEEVIVSPKEFQQATGSPIVDPSKVYVISAALGQRIYWKQV
jgi:hypothetical protein